MTAETIGPALSGVSEPGLEAQQGTSNVIPLRGRSEDSGKGTIKGERPVWVDPGIYELAFQFHETAVLFRTGKLICHFTVVTQGKYFGVTVQRHYNAEVSNKKRRRGGAFTVGWKSDFIREYTRIFGLPPKNKVSTDPFSKVIVRARIGPVTKSSGNKSIPKELQYSVVTELLERVQ